MSWLLFSQQKTGEDPSLPGALSEHDIQSPAESSDRAWPESTNPIFYMFPKTDVSKSLDVRCSLFWYQKGQIIQVIFLPINIRKPSSRVQSTCGWKKICQICKRATCCTFHVFTSHYGIFKPAIKAFCIQQSRKVIHYILDIVICLSIFC